MLLELHTVLAAISRKMAQLIDTAVDQQHNPIHLSCQGNAQRDPSIDERQVLGCGGCTYEVRSRLLISITWNLLVFSRATGQ